MKQQDIDAWVKRAEEVLAMNGWESLTPIHMFAVSFVEAFYGPASVQFKSLKDSVDAMQRNSKSGPPAADIAGFCRGVIESTLAEIKAGLIVNVRAQIQGEVLGELITLAKDALTETTDSSMQVAAVLTAAAFEDILRRLAGEKAGLTGRPKLEQVVNALKDGDVLKGGEISTANGYLKFRNDSLHADWAQVHRFQVESCILFVESLLLKHFS